MKLLSIRIAACLSPLLFVAVAAGQNASPIIGHPAEIVLHRQQAAVESAAVATNVRQVSAETVPTLPDASFPSLAPRAGENGLNQQPGPGADREVGMARPAITVASSLAVVLGLFAAMVWMTRKFNSRTMGQGVIPKEVLHGLGSTAIDSRTRVTMVRCGNRILVMAQTATGVHPLTEITDPQEVIELTARCLGDSKKSFASTLKSIEKEKTDAGFLGSHHDVPKGRSRGRLFASA